VGRQVQFGEVHDQQTVPAQQASPAPAVAHRLPLVAGNQAVGRLLVQRETAAETPKTAPGQAVLPPGVSSPVNVAAQLGVDYDAKDGGAAYGRLESLWIKDMFTALQILRVNGSAAERGHAPYKWMIDNRAAAPPRAQLVLKVMGAPDTVAASDFNGWPSDQEREVRAFMALRSWDDPVNGLPRKTGTAPTEQQRDSLDYIRRRRAVATNASGTVRGAHGYQYGGRPAADPLPTGIAARTLEAEIWEELDLEGSASAVNTYDDQVLTWGKGWSAKTTLPAIADAFFRADPAAKQELMEAGFTYSPTEKKFLFVSLNNGYVMDGIGVMDTAEFRDDKKFVGLLAHLVEDPEHQQKMVDAQYAALATNTANVPKSIRDAWPGTWTTEAVRFAAHCVHWGRSWSEAQAHGPAIHDLILWISRIKGRQDGTGATMITGWSSQTIRHFAHRAAERLMSRPGPLPANTVAGTFYFQDDGTNNPNYWTWRP
jgi:hypothetical protein